METFAKDLQLAVRMLLKKPGFTVIAVLTLALGIAVNATMFSMVSAFLLRRPPGRDPQRSEPLTIIAKSIMLGEFLARAAACNSVT